MVVFYLWKDGYWVCSRNVCRVTGGKSCHNILYLLCKCLIKISGWGRRWWEAWHREVTRSIWQKNWWNSSSKYLTVNFIMVLLIWHPLDQPTEHWFCKNSLRSQHWKECRWSMSCQNFKAENTFTFPMLKLIQKVLINVN